ncbi:MerR family DNA-binding transcriptional regulator [Microbaculum marinum]|uniref:MerR family DNA-binding transcriptional regulator n=1 Tax=Microbaculum marinum TaxID=1764581 RepID=A0AAW9RFF6_9HYPH
MTAEGIAPRRSKSGDGGHSTVDDGGDSGAGSPRQSAFTIGDLSREFDVTLRTIRFYEDKGLLNPRRIGTKRLYSRRDRARLKLILLGKKVGFSLAEISEMLDLYDLKDGQVTQLRVALGKFDQQIGFLTAQRDDIDQALADLKRAREVVSGMLKERERRGA